MNFKDKKALITGASRGIGMALAKELALCGCEVFVNYA
ncbi:MAG: SDR family NAD(P)-dependent oxidoreductase [Clostridia bacterium]|nr:SDR family NAD(P)-dependent oxidoreductase [Clostridia bacterium]